MKRVVETSRSIRIPLTLRSHGALNAPNIRKGRRRYSMSSGGLVAGTLILTGVKNAGKRCGLQQVARWLELQP
jgi:hypothetical protein